MRALQRGQGSTSGTFCRSRTAPRVAAAGVRCRAAARPSDQPQPAHTSSSAPLPRRTLLAGSAALLAAATAAGAAAPQAARAEAASEVAAAPGLSRYQDPEGFAISVPSDWAAGEGQLTGNASFTGATGSRRTLAWFPSDGKASPNDVNVTITITNTSLEFTKLGSFGTAYTFGQNLVNSMDTSFFARARGGAADPNVQVAKLVDAAERNDEYWIEYTVHKPALEPQPRHLLSTVSLGFNGRYNRLITITAQCRENQLGEYKPLFDSVLKSFTPPPKQVL